MSKTMELLSSETLVDDPYTYARPRTEEELKAHRDFIDMHAGAEGFSAGDTCDDCARRYICTLVFDPYNCDGDCLYDK